jgi:ParB-like chromosome segregation protein Spo0J
MAEIIQPMPELTSEELDSLRTDIAANGVLVPVVKDQHGRIIDGNHRATIATELGIDYPVTVIQVADDLDAWDKAVSLNCARRHLNREQRRDLVRAEIRRRPEDSDRAIARRVGCSPSTVGSVRADIVWAEEHTKKIRNAIEQEAIQLFIAVHRVTKLSGWTWEQATEYAKKVHAEECRFTDEAGIEPDWFWDTAIAPKIDQLREEFREELSNLDTQAVAE